MTTGKPSKWILELAEEVEVDQIVMENHGRSDVGRVLFGSIAETVTCHAVIPVTIVR